MFRDGTRNMWDERMNSSYMAERDLGTAKQEDLRNIYYNVQEVKF